MEYMSPEQALGTALDQRSDLFTLGLIFYELLSGKMPFAADSALASLIKRTQERAVPVSQHDKTIPPALTQIVASAWSATQNCGIRMRQSWSAIWKHGRANAQGQR
jgi:serine/threonine protein kinase